VTDLWSVLIDWAFRLVMALVTVFVYFWGRDRQQQVEAIERRFKGIEARLEKGSEGFSKLSSTMQALVGRLDRMPEILRGSFLSLDLAEDRLAASQREREALWQEIRALRERAR